MIVICTNSISITPVKKQNCSIFFVPLVLLFLLPPQSSHSTIIKTVHALIDSNCNFLSAFHNDSYIGIFYLQKNDLFKKWYNVDSKVTVKFDILSYQTLFSYEWFFTIHAGMGKTPNNIIFKPMDNNFIIVQNFIYKMHRIDLLVGLDHRCYHEIDKKEFPTLFWNKCTFTIASKNRPLYEFCKNLRSNKMLTMPDRYGWSITWSYFVRNFFNLTNKENVNGGHPYKQDLICDMRYALLQKGRWVLTLNNSFTYNSGWHTSKSVDDYEGTFWINELSLESIYMNETHGSMFFLTYTRDHLPLVQDQPRYSKDGTLLVGLRMFM